MSAPRNPPRPPAPSRSSTANAPPDALNEAETHLRQQAALRDDARAQEADAAKTRSDADASVARAETAHAEALAASANDRSNDDLADLAARKAVLLTHARADHAKAIATHDDATGRLRETEKNVAGAERALERAKAQQAMSDTGDTLQANVLGALAATIKARELFVAARKGVQERARLARLAHTHGAPATLPVPDGTSAAAALAGALLELGGAPVPGANLQALRWCFETDTARPDPDGVEALITFARLVFEVLKGGTRPGAEEQRPALERFAAAFSRHPDWLGAQAELAALERAAGNDREARLRGAHDQRIADEQERAKARPPVELAQMERARQAREAQVQHEHTNARRRADAKAFDDASRERANAERSAQAAGMRQLANGEWIIGDDVSADIPVS